MFYQVASKIAGLEPSATEEVDNMVRLMKRRGVDEIISLSVGEPCFDTPQNIKQAANRALNEGKTKYESTAGSYELRVELSDKLKQEIYH